MPREVGTAARAASRGDLMAWLKGVGLAPGCKSSSNSTSASSGMSLSDSLLIVLRQPPRLVAWRQQNKYRS
jgi:hypothetical protein